MNKNSTKSRSNSKRASILFNKEKNDANSPSKKLDFQNFYNFAKSDERKGSISKKRIMDLDPPTKREINGFIGSYVDTAAAKNINISKSKLKLKKIFLVITSCLYLKNYVNKFGVDPKIFDDIFQNAEKDKIKEFMTKDVDFEDFQKNMQKNEEDNFLSTKSLEITMNKIYILL